MCSLIHYLQRGSYFCRPYIYILLCLSAVNLFNKDFTKCVAVDSIFENYKDAQEYMNFLGVELYMDENKVGFKKIYSQGSDAR